MTDWLASVVRTSEPTIALKTRKNVIQLYIRVSVVLSQSPARKERQKLDITLDSTVFVCRGKEI
jgi:hypothetical protein